MKKVLTLYSSARPDGNTYQMVSLFNCMVDGETSYLDSLDINQYDYNFNNQEDDFVGIIDSMLEADIIVFASPVYWYSLTPTFKTFIDRLTDLTELSHLKPKGKQLREKVFYLFATSVHEQAPDSFTHQVEHTLRYFGWNFKDTIHINCRDGFDEPLATMKLLEVLNKINASTCSVSPIAQTESARLMSYFK